MSINWITWGTEYGTTYKSSQLKKKNKRCKSKSVRLGYSFYTILTFMSTSQY